MKINWGVRMKNRAFLTGMISLVIVFIYNLLALMGVSPRIEQSTVLQVCEGILTMLGMLGVIVDPTTAGIEDSNRAMGYTEPNRD